MTIIANRTLITNETFLGKKTNHNNAYLLHPNFEGTIAWYEAETSRSLRPKGAYVFNLWH